MLWCPVKLLIIFWKGILLIPVTSRMSLDFPEPGAPVITTHCFVLSMFSMIIRAVQASCFPPDPGVVSGSIMNFSQRSQKASWYLSSRRDTHRVVTASCKRGRTSSLSCAAFETYDTMPWTTLEIRMKHFSRGILWCTDLKRRSNLDARAEGSGKP